MARKSRSVGKFSSGRSPKKGRPGLGQVRVAGIQHPYSFKGNEIRALRRSIPMGGSRSSEDEPSLWSIQFDAFTSEVAIDGSGGELDVTTEFSLQMWMRIVSSRPWSTSFFNKGDEATFKFQQSSTQQFLMDIQSFRDNFTTATDFRDRIRDGRWHKVGISWTQGEACEVVVDGV